MHSELNTAILQIKLALLQAMMCQLPAEAAGPPCNGARFKQPAYGMIDAPHNWWNRLDAR